VSSARIRIRCDASSITFRSGPRGERRRLAGDHREIEELHPLVQHHVAHDLPDEM